MIRQCAICTCQVIGHANRMYCSKPCQNESRKEYDRKYHLTHVTENRKHNGKYRSNRIAAKQVLDELSKIAEDQPVIIDPRRQRVIEKRRRKRQRQLERYPEQFKEKMRRYKRAHPDSDLQYRSKLNAALRLVRELEKNGIKALT